MLLAGENASGESLNGLPLVTLGLVSAYQLKVHISIIWDEKKGATKVPLRTFIWDEKKTD